MPLLPNQPNLLFEDVDASEDAAYLLSTKVNSEFYRWRFSQRADRWKNNPAAVAKSFSSYKTYYQKPRVPLAPNLEIFRQIDWEDVVLRRRSKRAFNGREISFAELSNLLLMSLGLKADGKWLEPPEDIQAQNIETTYGARRRRALPSGGAMYPLEFYILVRHVRDLQPGLYHFSPLFRSLFLLKTESEIPPLDEFLSQHELFQDPAAIFFAAAVFDRSRIKYGPRSLRLILLEAGGIAVQMNLLATAMGIDFSLDGGGLEDRIESLIGIDGQREGLVSQFMVGHSAQ